MPRPLSLALLLLVPGCRKPGGVLHVDWSFGDKGCEAAGIASVRLAVTGMPAALLPCKNGQGRAGGTVEGVPPGIHSIQLEALGASGKPLYEGDHEAIEVLDDFTTALRLDLERIERPRPPPAPK